jgi:cell division protease FtsH
VAELVPRADPVHKISIIPRGVAALGYTQQLPTDDRYLIQKPELDDRIAVLLGGRAAEEIVFGEISTGAGNDLERASEIARRMVAELGMSERVGPVTYIRRRQTFLQMQEDGFGGGGGEYSQETAREIDAEVRKFLVQGYDRAIHILREHRAILDELARRLLEKEVVDRDELRSLMDATGERGPDAGEHEVRRPEIGHIPSRAAS